MTFGPSAQNVYFYYDPDVNGNGIPDSEEGHFAERFVLFNDHSVGVPGSAPGSAQFIGGTQYAKTAPVFNNYVSVGFELYESKDDSALGYKIGGEEYITNPADRVKVGDFSVVYDVPAAPLKYYNVLYLYKKDMNRNGIPDEDEGSATLTVTATTYGGTDITLYTHTVRDWIGENVAGRLSIPADTINTNVWEYISGSIPNNLVLTDTPQSIEIKYKEKINFSVIEVKWNSDDGQVTGGYKVEQKKDAPSFTAQAFNIPNYEVVGWEITNPVNGSVLRSGVGTSVVVSPADGSQILTFTYRSTLTTVTVKAIDSDTGALIDMVTYIDATIGKPYSVNAPYIDNTWALVDRVITKTVPNVAQGSNVVEFLYSKITADVVVLLKENDTNGNIILVYQVEVPSGTERDIQIPNLEQNYYTELPQSVIHVDNTSGTPDHPVVEYYYTKDLMDVTIQAVDKAGGASPLLGTRTLTLAARKGEMYRASALDVPWYTLAENHEKSVYADPAANPFTVEFLYEADDVGEVVVRCYYMEGGVKNILSEYSGKAIVGSKFTGDAGDFAGFELVNPSL
jgi:hypothetical protein